MAYVVCRAVTHETRAAGGPHRVSVIDYGGEWENLLDGLRQGLRELGVEEGTHVILDVRDAKGDLKAVEAAARALEAAKVDAIITPVRFEAFFQISDAMITAQAQTIIDILREKRLPALFHETNLCDKGGTFYYGQNYREVGQMMAKVLQRIFAGRSPKD
jgi:ABC-type uncharacterized transport system substrate-binding protein